MDHQPRDRFGFPHLDGNSVLIIDDHHDSAQFMAELLEFCGGEVWTTSSAAEARQQIKRRQLNSSVVSLIICDFQMPRETGTQFMRWLRAQPGDVATVPAVAVTAYEKDFLANRDDIRAFDAFFVKPLDTPKFLRTVETILSRPPELKRS